MSELARAGGALGCLSLSVLLLSGSRVHRLAAVAGWALGSGCLALYLAPHAHRPLLAAAGIVGLVAAVGLAAVVHRWPWTVAFATLALVPARLPVHVGGTSANLLLPLYGLVVAAAIALGWELLRGDVRAHELGVVRRPLAALVAWTGITILWTADLRQGAISLLFFYLPFGLLAVVLARLPWSRRALTGLVVELAAMAVAFAAVGVYQWTTRDIFWNPKVIVGNAYAPFFRVNSVFWDPSVYGRFLVVAILACLAVVLRGRAGRAALSATAAIAVIWTGLLFSFSQSSFAALVVGVLLAATLAWRWRAAAAVALVAAVLLAVGFSAPRIRHSLLGHSRAGLNHASSGRLKLVTNGAKLAYHHPVGGLGIGSFRRGYADLVGLRGKEPKSAASHDTPVTVAAETGIPGLVLFAWLLWSAFSVPLRRVLATYAGHASLIVGLGLAAIAVHSLFYNAFFEDPMMWGLLALAALLTRAPTEEEAR